MQKYNVECNIIIMLLDQYVVILGGGDGCKRTPPLFKKYIGDTVPFLFLNVKVVFNTIQQKFEQFKGYSLIHINKMINIKSMSLLYSY